MIGLGIWEVPVNTPFFKTTAKITIKDNNGKYDFEFYVPEIDLSDIKVLEASEEGNTLNAKATADKLKGKVIPVSITFENDTCSGLIKAPFIGKIKVNGKKIG